jgi:uncharacterized protein (TIGR03435 family)
MLRARTLAALFPLLALTAPTLVFAQTADPPQSPLARVFHPAPPLPSYDVATVKPAVNVSAPNGMIMMGGTTVRQYIRMAYSLGIGQLGQLAPAQVVGGPDWIEKDRYEIQGKPSPDLEAALQKMNNEDRAAQTRSMQQSLLADRFHLKVHFEVREMPVYALVPAKGGLKIKAVDAPAPRDPNSPPPPLTPGKAPPMPAGMMATMMKPDGSRTMTAHVTQMANLIGFLGSQGGVGGRPILDQTGFTGSFDIPDLTFAPLNASADASNAASDAPSLATALEDSLGIKLVATKGPVEVVVIDSIDHPSDN